MSRRRQRRLMNDGDEEEEEGGDLMQCDYCGRRYPNDNWRTSPEEGFCSADCMATSMVHMDGNPEALVRQWFREQGHERPLVLLPPPGDIAHLNPVSGEVGWEEALAIRLEALDVEDRDVVASEQLPADVARRVKPPAKEGK